MRPTNRGLLACLLIIGLFLFITLRALVRLTEERDAFPRLAGTGMAALMQGAIQLADQHDLSSVHVTFCTGEEAELAEAMGLMHRTGQQFHWMNRDYADFDAFLADLSSRKRKTIRKERRTAQAFGGTIRQITGDQFEPEHCDAFWAFYQDTGARKWGTPYLTRRFFDIAHERFPDLMMMVLAERDGRVVGRIGACIDTHSNDHHDEQVGFFGFYENDDDPEAAKALLNTAAAWIAERGMDTMRGPGCFNSNHDWYGLQVDGRFNRPVVGMPYNPRYYEKHLEEYGLTKAKDLLAWEIRTRGEFPEKMRKLIERILARPGLVIRPMDMKNFLAEASVIRQLYNDCWHDNWGFVPLDDEGFAYMAKDMKSMVDADFLLVAEVEGKPVGFSLTIPDFNQALQPLRGKLLPFGWLKFLLGIAFAGIAIISHYRTIHEQHPAGIADSHDTQ